VGLRLVANPLDFVIGNAERRLQEVEDLQL
jgi:hypothetical protein